MRLTNLAIDSRGDIESHEEGYSTRDAGKSVGQVDLRAMVSGRSRCLGGTDTYHAGPLLRRPGAQERPVKVQVGQKVPASCNVHEGRNTPARNNFTYTLTPSIKCSTFTTATAEPGEAGRQ